MKWIFSCFLGMTLAFHSSVFGQTLDSFTVEQAGKGRIAYAMSCERCHGEDLRGAEFAPPLRGYKFAERWGGRSVGELVSRIKLTMPPGNTGTLSNEEYLRIVAYILQAYGLKAGSDILPDDAAHLDKMVLPKAPIRALSPGAPVPPWPSRPKLSEQLAPVTQAMLNSPPPESWLSWRRTQDASGFSPLKRITKANVRALRLVWSLALGQGPNQSTPLVHDGVIFVNSFGDHVQALDAATGDELWRYSRQLPPGISAIVHRNMALYDDKLFLATSDSSLIALSTKSGRVMWEQKLAGESNAISGGPLVVGGVVMQGLGGRRRGGQVIVGLDAATGKHLWQFNTVAQPGELHGDSWNGLPLEKRTGGTIWTAGSYDPSTNLAFFGPAPTYDTDLLSESVNRPGISNDALYTDSTVALDPRTGRLVWHYQHMPNDQWNLDWAFERQLISFNGSARKLVVTAGKIAIYDALDAATGEYAFSVDVGLQNLISSIDPKTGRKVIDRTLTPNKTRTVTVCPHSAGARSWLPGSYDATTQILYVPLVEACTDWIPLPKGDIGVLSTGAASTLRPRADSDGRYGRLQAIDLVKRQKLWAARQRSPLTTGTLATAGGVVFAGGLDRWFKAYDAASGEVLWESRLSEVPNSAPITYLVEGKQYVAIVVGTIVPWGQAAAFVPFIPETQSAFPSSSAIFVFDLAE